MLCGSSSSGVLSPGKWSISRWRLWRSRALRAFRLSSTFSGDGPERTRLEQRAAALDLADVVRFEGFQPQQVCAARLATSDALILNSVWECGGAVVLEAMAMGLAVLGPGWGGPADYLDDSCGILVSPVPRDSFAQRLAEAIGRLWQDADWRRRLGEAGAEKVRRDYDWEKKVDRMLEVYSAAAAGDRLRAGISEAV